MIDVFDTGHIHSIAVCRAFAHGAGAPVRRAPWRPSRAGRATFVYGKLRGTLDVVAAARAAGGGFFMADNGYLKPGHYSGFYRVTRDAFQLGSDAPGCPPDFARGAVLGVEIAPWRKAGRHILVCPPIPEYEQAMGFDGAAWLDRVLLSLKSATDRPIAVRRKPGDSRAGVTPRPLAEDLAGAWALVTHDSNVAVEAALAGVPVFATGHSPVVPWVGLADPGLIETPCVDADRETWLARLAANQWTLGEMRAGRCWSDLTAIREAAA